MFVSFMFEFMNKYCKISEFSVTFWNAKVLNKEFMRSNILNWV